MKNEIQNNDITLPGGLGTVGIGNTTREITKYVARNDGSVTLNIGAVVKPKTQDIQYEIISPELPPGIQIMFENFRWAKSQMNGSLGISEDRIGRETGRRVLQYANATRDYEAYIRMFQPNGRKNLRAARRFERATKKHNIRLAFSIIKRRK